MSSPTATVETLFDRLPAVGPAVRRRSRLRTLATLTLLLVLAVIIGGYIFVTDSHRVRELSERYLSRAIGGRVVVGRASLSIFEGLRLDNIKVYNTNLSDHGQDDTLLFEARSLLVGYNPRALIAGRVEATRVLALEPHIRLVENVDENLWNFQTLRSGGARYDPSPGTESLTKIALPEIVLRNAKIDYWQISNGVRSQVGTLAIEGQLTPDFNDVYRFRLQSRGGTPGVFPIAEGWLSAGGDSLGVTLRDVEFVDEIKTILPAVVRQFWEEHQLAGRIGETRVSYFRKPDGRAGFKVETDLDGVRLAVPPQQWLGPVERARAAKWEWAFKALGGQPLGGSSVARALAPAMTPRPLQLDEVDGTFVFTDTQIAVNNLVARVEANRFKVSGTAEGYDASAPFKVRIQSLASQDIVIPESPTYITALPWPMQEIYYRFSPRGTASFWVDITRHSSAERVALNGEMYIRDGGFSYEKFPYPIDRASGKLVIGTDPQTGREMLDIVEIVGRGYAGGVNADATVRVSGRITPLDETAGADVVIHGNNIRNEPRLIAAMPPLTRKAILSFDAAGTGKMPTFEADFECHVTQAVGIKTPALVSTTLDIRNAAGMMLYFPYPLENVAAKLVVHDDRMEVSSITLQRNGATAKLTGGIVFRHRLPSGEEIVAPDLVLDARNVAIDDDLLGALPARIAGKLREAALKGSLDLRGTIKPGTNDDDVTIDLDTRLSGGTARFADGAAVLTDITAQARLTQNNVAVPKFTARLGTAGVQGSATFDWDGIRPGNAMSVRLESVPVDEALIARLPTETQQPVRALRLTGTIDADIEAAAGSFRAVVRPKTLAMKPDLLPLTMEKLSGEIVIEPRSITLRDLSARVGDGTLRASGTIDRATGAADFALSARALAVDRPFVVAMPAMIKRVFENTAFAGMLSADVSSLRFTPGGGEGLAATPDRTRFAGTLWLENAALEVGASVRKAKGAIKLAGDVRGNDVAALNGEINLESLTLADRPIRRLTAVIVKPEGRDVLQIGRIRGDIAGGEIAGQVDTLLSERDPRFGMSIVLRNASVSEITGELDKPIDGRLTASLQLEGRWDNAAGRRGRGDVIVEGRDMYRVPVLFGLMQMATLTVPIDSFNRAGLRYNVEGNKVNMETIDLRSKDSVMQGTGWIDFDKKTVSMTLTTVGGAADAVPIFGDLIRTARQDLLQVRVRGTLQEPDVGASSFNTLRTTIDEVLRGKN